MRFNLLRENEERPNWQQPENIVLALSTIFLGVIVGFSSLLLSLLLEVVEHFFLHYEETAKIPAPINTLPIDRLISVVIGGVIAALIWWGLRT